VVLAGGTSHEPALPAGLAALIDAEVCRSNEPEAGLAGAARLAAGLDPRATQEIVPVPAGPAGAYLREKYARWKIWMRAVLGARPVRERTG
jgi:sugar (pentulose or hexulose) kinase